MFLRTALLAAAAMIGGRISARTDVPLSMPLLDQTRSYRFRPFTNRNIGRDWLKYGGGHYRPHQGRRECARRVRQIAEGQLRRANGLAD